MSSTSDMSNKKITIGIAGGAGYTAGELLRILLFHPNADIKFVFSTSNAGKPVAAVHTDLEGDTNMLFSGETSPVDVVFLCLGHGISREFLTIHPLDKGTKVIDLGNDFRLDGIFEDKSFTRNFIYGLPELSRDEIKNANNIANPGCFATAIQLSLLPLTANGLMNNELHVNATTGSTGAGRSLSATTHFSYRNDNLSTYKVFSHQHLREIKRTLLGLKGAELPEINFVPQRGDFARGIFSTVYTHCDISEEEAIALYRLYYKDHPFTHVIDREVSMKDAVNTNKCFINVKKYGNKLFVTAAIDNLLKGASGQAVQNMNLMFGLDETCGLYLKPIGF